MVCRRICRVFLLLPIAAFAAAAGETRECTDIEGRTMEVTFNRMGPAGAVLRMDGTEYTVPLARLSPDDREAARRDWRIQLAGAAGERENPRQ